jgi:hypothetical protein
VTVEDKIKSKAASLWAAAICITAVRAYLLMLALGVLHLQWTAAIPALSFWECLVLSTAFTFVKR